MPYAAGPVNVAVWSDYLCPWCYLGQSRAAQLEADHGADITWLPYELHPELPDGGRAVVDVYGRGDPARAARAMDRFAAMCAEEELDFVPPTTVHPTRRAHQVALLVGHRDPDGLARFHRDLFRAVWVADADCEDLDLLAELASGTGVDGDEARTVAERDELLPAVHASMGRAQEWGITGTPAFLFEGTFVLPGYQPAEVVDQIASRVAERLAAADDEA